MAAHGIANIRQDGATIFTSILIPVPPDEAGHAMKAAVKLPVMPNFR